MGRAPRRCHARAGRGDGSPAVPAGRPGVPRMEASVKVLGRAPPDELHTRRASDGHMSDGPSHRGGSRSTCNPGSHRTMSSEVAAMARTYPDPYLVLGVSPTRNPGRDHPRLPQPDYAPITPTPAEHRPRTPPTNTCGKCWPPTPCCVTLPAAPTTTAVLLLLALSRHHICAWYRNLRSGPTMDRPRSRSAPWPAANRYTVNTASPPLRVAREPPPPLVLRKQERRCCGGRC